MQEIFYGVQKWQEVNGISCNDRHKCQYFEQMDLWNDTQTNMVNHMPTNAMEGEHNQGI